jgi:hypothetical protein
LRNSRSFALSFRPLPSFSYPITHRGLCRNYRDGPTRADRRRSGKERGQKASEMKGGDGKTLLRHFDDDDKTTAAAKGERGDGALQLRCYGRIDPVLYLRKHNRDIPYLAVIERGRGSTWKAAETTASRDRALPPFSLSLLLAKQESNSPFLRSKLTPRRGRGRTGRASRQRDARERALHCRVGVGGEVARRRGERRERREGEPPGGGVERVGGGR